MVPLGDHLGSVGDSTNSGLPPATQTRFVKSLQTQRKTVGPKKQQSEGILTT